jgi:hypothetical protein
MADIMVGGGRYNHTQLLKNYYPHLPDYDEVGVMTKILVGSPPAYQIWERLRGGFEHIYDYTNTDWDIINAASDGDGDGDGDLPEDDTKPPDFPPTGPVFTPLDPAGIAQRNYSKYYPEYTEAPTVRAASPYPTMGLLSDPYGGADVDLYQPWSHKYGANVAPSSLWNYEPPSGLDVGPGPKVGYVK